MCVARPTKWYKGKNVHTLWDQRHSLWVLCLCSDHFLEEYSRYMPTGLSQLYDHLNLIRQKSKNVSEAGQIAIRFVSIKNSSLHEVTIVFYFWLLSYAAFLFFSSQSQFMPKTGALPSWQWHWLSTRHDCLACVYLPEFSIMGSCCIVKHLIIQAVLFVFSAVAQLEQRALQFTELKCFSLALSHRLTIVAELCLSNLH